MNDNSNNYSTAVTDIFHCLRTFLNSEGSIRSRVQNKVNKVTRYCSQENQSHAAMRILSQPHKLHGVCHLQRHNY